RPAPGNRAHVRIGETVDLEHDLAGGVDLFDRPRQLEAEQARAFPQPFAMLAELENLAIVGALPFEHAARIVERMRQHMDPRVAPRHHLAVVPDPAVAIVERALKLSHVLILLRGCNAPSARWVPRQAKRPALRRRARRPVETPR